MAIPNNPAFTQAIIDWFTANPDPITPTNPEVPDPVYGLISNWDTSNITSMASAFDAANTAYSAEVQASIPNFNQNLSSWDTHLVESMENMFSQATMFNNGAAPGVGGVPFTADGDIWNTGAVLSMFQMFGNCAAFNQDVSSWDTHAVTTMQFMFGEATTFNNGAEPGVGGVPFNRTLDSIWDTGQVTDMFYMFGGCAAFNQNVSSWDTHAVTTMNFMFAGATTFNNGAAPGVGGVPFDRTLGSIWNTGQVLSMAGMFFGCVAFNQNVSSWDTHAVTTMFDMFNGATTFNNGAEPGVGGVPFNRTLGSIWDTGAVLFMNGMFFDCAAFNQNVSSWDTNAVTTMQSMFNGATMFNNGAEPGVGGVPFTAVGDIWNTGAVLDMGRMFVNCAAFNQNVSSWDTHAVTTMEQMFNGATTFNNGADPGVGGVPFTADGNIWNTGQVLSMAGMFFGCVAFNQNVSSWDTHAVTIMSGMFLGATMFNNGANPGVGGVPFDRTPNSIWDTRQVLNMYAMFGNCAAFNQNVSSWDTHAVTTMGGMFGGATTFNNGAAPGVGGVPFNRTPNSIWDTGAVLDMVGMFFGCDAFNQNVSSWDTHLVESMENMFEGATLFIGTGLDVWLLTLKPNILDMFINSAVPGSVNNNLIWNTWKTRNAYSIAELAAAGLIEPTPTPTPTPPIVSDICFPAGTPIKTDQGVIPIELLVPGKHTIRRQSIEHVTQTVTLDKYLIAFQPNAVDYKVPNKKTVMSKDHCIVFKGQLVPAYRFLDYSDQVKKVTYSGELLYNVLLATHGVMEVNNMQCETLHPANTIAKVYQNRFKNNLLEKGWTKKQPFSKRLDQKTTF